jgi:thiamine-phosphate pyrophosphorylase
MTTVRVDFRVYLITDRRQASGGDTVRTVALALDGGIRAVQLREKDLPGKELYRLAGRIRELTARYGARLLVNDRVDVALAVGADGVHLGGSSMPASVARRLLGKESLIGCSTHNTRELRDAAAQGADFATFGPVYQTPSKAPYGPPVGVAALATACRETNLPLFALGGVEAGNAREVIEAGAFGIALISYVMAAADPCEAARNLLACFTNVRAAALAGGEIAKEGEA